MALVMLRAEFCFHILGSVECAEAPDDLKLSDGGGCAVGLRGAAAVTAGAVRCSAWLGAFVGDSRIEAIR